MRELVLRGIKAEGTFDKMISTLRDRLEAEEEMYKQEETQYEQFKEDTFRSTDKELREKLRLEHEIILRQQLESLDLYMNLEGTHAELAFRHQLWKRIEHLSHSMFSEVQTQDMSLSQLQAEFKLRRLSLPDGVKEEERDEEKLRQLMIKKLNQAVVEDLEKIPLKYDFGSQFIKLEDVAELPPPVLSSIIRANGKRTPTRREKQVSAVCNIIVSKTHEALIAAVKDELSSLGVDVEEMKVGERESDLMTPPHASSSSSPSPSSGLSSPSPSPSPSPSSIPSTPSSMNGKRKKSTTSPSKKKKKETKMLGKAGNGGFRQFCDDPALEESAHTFHTLFALLEEKMIEKNGLISPSNPTRSLPRPTSTRRSTPAPKSFRRKRASLSLSPIPSEEGDAEVEAEVSDGKVTPSPRSTRRSPRRSSK